MANEQWMQLYLQAWALRTSKADFLQRWRFFWNYKVVLCWEPPTIGTIKESMLK